MNATNLSATVLALVGSDESKDVPAVTGADFEVIKPEHFGFSSVTGIGDKSLNWVPVLVPVTTLQGKGETPVRCGTFMAICRPGYWEDPLGMVASETSYKPVNHTDSARAVEECGAAITSIGAKIDAWGHRVVHAWKLDLIGEQNAEGNFAPHEVRGMPVSCVLNLVHDHTGTGAVYASIVVYLGTRESCRVLGAFTRIRKIHKGEGTKRVGVGSGARWTDLIAALCEQAVIAQDAIVTLLREAAATPLTLEAALAFRAQGIFVDSETVDGKEVFSGTLLDVMGTHHESRRGDVKWGVWAKRLECDAIRTVDEILHPDTRVTPIQEALRARVR